MKKPKLIRLTTVPLSFNVLLKGPLRFMSAHFEVLAVSSGPQEVLDEVSLREGVSTVQIEMTRSITPLQGLKAVWPLIRLFKNTHLKSLQFWNSIPFLQIVGNASILKRESSKI